MKELDDVLQHVGVKGMRWGKRKSESSGGSSSKSQHGSKTEKVKARVKEELKSAGRELQWRKVARDVDKMSTKEINDTARRIQTENDFKRLSRGKRDIETSVRRLTGDKTLPTSKDRQDYRRRGDMSDVELGIKVGRLRAKEAMSRAMTQASKEQIDIGKKVVNAAKGSSIKDPQKDRDKVLREAGFTRR